MTAPERRFQQDLGQNMRRARLARGLTQQELAGAIGTTRASVANLEAGRQRMSAYVLVLAAGTLGVTTAELIPDAGSEDGGRRPARLAGDVPDAHRMLLTRLLASAADRKDRDASSQAQYRGE